MKPEPEHKATSKPNLQASANSIAAPGIEGEVASKRDHLAVRLGGPKTLWILLAVLLCLFSSGLMMLLPSKSVDVESVYGDI